MEKANDSKIKIVFVEDYPIYEGSVVPILTNVGYLRKNIYICRNSEEAKATIKAENPQIAIVDLHIPAKPQDEGNLEVGLDLVRWITDQYGDKTRVIALSRFPYRWVVFQVLASGVSFVDKREFEELSWVIDRVLHGHVVYTSKLTPVVRDAFREAIDFKLEQEDIEILSLIHYQDLTDRQIGDKLGRAGGEDWAGNRLRELRKRIGIKDRHQLAAWYWQFIAPIQGIKPPGLDKKT